MTDINFYIPATFLLFFSLQKICSKKRGCKDKNIYFTTAIFSDNIFFLSSFPKKHQNQLANTDYISDITNLKKKSAVGSQQSREKRQKEREKCSKFCRPVTQSPSHLFRYSKELKVTKL